MPHLRCFLAASLSIALSLGDAKAQPSPPLRLTLACAEGAATGDPRPATGDVRPATSEPRLTFRLTIDNASSTPTAVIVGAILGNDKTYLLQRVELTVRRTGAPDERLTYVDPSVAGIAGRVDPWLVALPAGASYSISVPARHFVSLPDHAPGEFANAVKVQAQLTTHDMDNPNLDMQGLKFVKVWVGTLTSEWIDVADGCAR
jgi:hypothetical protein